MWILRIALLGTVALGLGCSKDGGVIVGRGTHDELLATCPTYVEIVTSQREAAA